MEEEVLLEFTRFPEEKQDQIRQLVSYCTLMGLTGKDLVSIGGKLDRIKRRKELESNLAIGLSYDCIPVGKSKTERTKNENRKWYYTSPGGIKYRFDRDGSYFLTIRNCNTNKQKQVYFDFLVAGPNNNYRANVMANVHHGVIQLNF